MSRSESDHPSTSILVSACRLLEAITGGYWTVVNFQYVRSVQQLNLQDVLSGNTVSGILRRIGLVSEFQRYPKLFQFLITNREAVSRRRFQVPLLSRDHCFDPLLIVWEIFSLRIQGTRSPISWSLSI